MSDAYDDGEEFFHPKDKKERETWLDNVIAKYPVSFLRLQPSTGQLQEDAFGTYKEGFDLACILVTGSLIDQLIRQSIGHEYDHKFYVDTKKIQKKAKKLGYLKNKHIKRIIYFMDAIRNQVAHVKIHTFNMLGLIPPKKGKKGTKDYWGSKKQHPIHDKPQTCAEYGLELYCDLRSIISKNKNK